MNNYMVNLIFHLLIFNIGTHFALSNSSHIRRTKHAYALSQTEKLNGKSIIFKNVSAIKRKSKMPVLLPSYLGNEKEQNELYPNTLEVVSGKYTIIVGFSEDCAGGNACRWGIISGEKVKKRVPLKGKKVILKNGLIGYFQDAVCNAVCSDSEITFYQKKYKYSFGVKAAKLNTMIKVVNSAIGGDI